MPRKHILVSNDDGISSCGIQALAKELSKKFKVTIVAPEREQSTMGHALTLHKPVRLFHIKKEKNLDQWALSGTPADCVNMGLRHILKKKPDLIISGINRGVNLGNDIYYSGTIAAAREGVVSGIPAIAASLDYSYVPGIEEPKKFQPAAKYVAKIANNVLTKGLPEGTLLNINFPKLEWKKIKGTKIAKQGFMIYSKDIKPKKDFKGKDYYWLGGKYIGFKNIKNSDCNLLDQGYITLTPCKIDVTNYELFKTLEDYI